MKESVHIVGDVREIEGRHVRSNSLSKYLCIARCRSSRLRMMSLHEDARRNDGCLRACERLRSGFVRIASLRGRCDWEKRLIRLLVRRDRSGSDEQRRVVR
jgi:hypothetical protein